MAHVMLAPPRRLVANATEPAATPWRTVTQAAARAQVSEKTVYREAKAKRLRHAKIGGRRELRFLDSWIDDWLIATSTPVERVS